MEPKNNELRRLGVVMEHMDGKISLVAEQYGSINEKLDSHTEILKSHREMISQIMEDIEVTKQDIQFIKAGFKRKVDTEEFETLERRVTLLEKRR